MHVWSHGKYSLGPKRVLSFFVASLALLVSPAIKGAANEAKQPWYAPKQAKELKNPVAVTSQALKSAGALYQQNCVICHGKTGASNGPAAGSLPQKPANFTDEKVMRTTTDGELFWKITTGRAPMPSWEDRLSEAERWQLVNYLRMLAMRAQYRYLGTAD
jgi:mono/diheme cytochrome c family protein